MYRDNIDVEGKLDIDGCILKLENFILVIVIYLFFF